MKTDAVTLERAGLLILLDQAWENGWDFRAQHGSTVDYEAAKAEFIRKLTGEAGGANRSMKDLKNIAPGYYWCTHDLERLAPDGGQFPREWQVIMFEDSVLWRTGTEISTHVSEVPDYVAFYGPLVGPAGAWQPIETAPKDGTSIDGWADGGRVADMAWQTPDIEWGRCKKPPGWCILEWHHEEMHWHEMDAAPTHWMPIPEGPR